MSYFLWKYIFKVAQGFGCAYNVFRCFQNKDIDLNKETAFGVVQ